jgi:Ni/Fe-hydrogenase subunit HybB-like protein
VAVTTNRTRIFKDVLWILALGGLVAAVFRLWYGLGATTNLSDEVPWGLWKILNMVAGVALSTGGFTIGFLAYVLKIERFKPLVKPAILVAFLGYGSSCLAVLFDIGIPIRFWHPFVMWNEHSFLFEVFWCVMLYFTVTFIEVLPPILERYGAQRVTRFLHRVAFGVVVVGISLSSLHHSSLGSLFLITPLRLHPLWYSSLLPPFFILSAMGAGMMVVVLLRILYAYWYDPEPVFGQRRDAPPRMTLLVRGQPPKPEPDRRAGRDMPALERLATIAVAILGVYLAIKVGDLLRTGAWRDLLAGTWESWLYAAELVVTAVVPIVLVAIPRARRSPTGLGCASFLAAAGLVMNRLDVGIFGYWHDAEVTYFPSLVEWALSLGVVAAAGLVFLAVVENFAIFDDNWRRQRADKRFFRASFDSFTHVWSAVLSSGLQRASLLSVFVLPLAWAMMSPGDQPTGTANPVEPPRGFDATRAVLLIDGNRAGVSTEFHHADHQRRLGADSSCVICHHVSLPGDRATPCSRCHRDMARPVRIFDHFHHMEAVAVKEQLTGFQPVNRSCAVCHAAGQAESAASAKDCLECHKEDMWLGGAPPDTTVQLTWASGFEQAMHHTCIACHERERERVKKPTLAECGTCHPTLRAREVAAIEPRD